MFVVPTSIPFRLYSIHNFVSVLDGQYFFENSASLNTFLNDSSPLPALPHTVSLRLSLENVTQLAILARRATLPRVRHLHITVERSEADWDWQTDCVKELTRFRLRPDNFHPSRSDLPYLRTFHLQKVFMGDIIILIKHFPSMARLESLTVVNSIVKGM
jgi:hypothetical protein